MVDSSLQQFLGCDFTLPSMPLNNGYLAEATAVRGMVISPSPRDPAGILGSHFRSGGAARQEAWAPTQRHIARLEFSLENWFGAQTGSACLRAGYGILVPPSHERGQRLQPCLSVRTTWWSGL